MPGVFLSTLTRWWNRLARFRRPESGRAPDDAAPARRDPASRNSAPALGVTADARHPATTARTDGASASAGPQFRDARADAEPTTEQSLIEVLGVDALPAGTVTMRVDPTVRGRTLADLDGLRQIPALQSLAQGFLRAMNQPEVAVAEVVASVEKDSALCVRILRMANSVLISPEHRIEDLETAVQMLGVKRVRQAAQALFTLRDANRVAAGFDWRHLWIHALATASIAEQLEQQLRAADDSQVHLAGLLHDVGKIVLSTIAPDAYREILIGAWNESGRLEDLERMRLGVDHREAGVLFATRNELPAVVIEAIAHHDRPELADRCRFEVALVAIANYLSKAHGLGFSGARLDDSDGEWASLPAWDVLAETCGFRPDPDQVETELTPFLGLLRDDLRALRDVT